MAVPPVLEATVSIRDLLHFLAEIRRPEHRSQVCNVADASEYEPSVLLAQESDFFLVFANFDERPELMIG
jgi:hypothetical protein